MWVLLAAIVGGMLTIGTAVATRLIDTWAEGEGARHRRMLVAEIELWNSLPERLKSGAGEAALRKRIDSGLVTYAAEELKFEGVDADWRIIERRLRRWFIAVGSVLVVVLSVAVARELEGGGQLDPPWNWIVAFTGVPVGFGLALVTTRLLVELMFRVLLRSARRTQGSQRSS